MLETYALTHPRWGNKNIYDQETEEEEKEDEDNRGRKQMLGSIKYYFSVQVKTAPSPTISERIVTGIIRRQPTAS